MQEIFMRVLLSFCNNKFPQVLSFHIEVRNLISYRSSNEIHMPSYATFLAAGHSMCFNSEETLRYGAQLCA